MLGFISKKKVIKAIKDIVNEYADVYNAPEGFGRGNYYYYSYGNMNAANYIAENVGIDPKIFYVKR